MAKKPPQLAPALVSVEPRSSCSPATQRRGPFSFRGQFTTAQQPRSVGNSLQMRGLMRDHQQRFTAIAPCPHQLADGGGGPWIEVGKRLIEQQEFRIVKHSARQR